MKEKKPMTKKQKAAIAGGAIAGVAAAVGVGVAVAKAKKAKKAK